MRLRRLIAGFKKKYGIKVNELNPDAGSGDEVEAIKANKGNKGPQAPDVIDVGLSFGPTAKAEGLLQPYKVSTWTSIPDEAKDADGYWYGDYYGVLAFEVNADMIDKAPADWSDLLKSDYKNAVALAGDPRSANQAIQAVYAAGLSQAQGRCRQGGHGRPRVLRRPEQERQFRAGDRQGRFAGAGHDADHRALGLQRAGRPRHAEGQSEGAGRRAEDGRRRRRLRAGDQRVCTASECRQAVDGISLLRRRPDRLADGLLPSDPLQRPGRRDEEDPGRRCSPSCRRQSAYKNAVFPTLDEQNAYKDTHHEAVGSRSSART